MKKMVQHLLAIALAFTLLPVLAFSQDEGTGEPAAESSAAEPMSLFDQILNGGPAMVPLALCLLAVFYLSFHSFIETRRQKFVPQTILPQVSTALRDRNIHAALDTLNSAPSALSRALGQALTKARPSQSDAGREKVETAFVELLDGEENAVGQWINYLNVVAAIAPMIGLLGTVSGMIGAFATLAQGGMGKPELLAGDIGEALVTTASGLTIGIPAMIAYFVMRNRLTNNMIATVQTGSLLIDYLAGEIEVDESGDTIVS